MLAVLGLDIENSLMLQACSWRQQVEMDDLPASGSGGAQPTPEFDCVTGSLADQ